MFVGASVSSETTSAAEFQGHDVMHDPFSSRPFLSYNAGNYIGHWLDMEKPGRKMPKIFHVNWFRRDAQVNWLAAFLDFIRPSTYWSNDSIINKFLKISYSIEL